MLIVAGNLCGWRWVNAMWFRLLHAGAIAVVVSQAWLGVACPLTTLEMWLRAQAGLATYSDSFIGHWLQRILYFDAPLWVFTLVYTLSLCWSPPSGCAFRPAPPGDVNG